MDDIKRKLALIDKELSGGLFNSYKRIVGTSPLLFAAIGLILGILIQNTLLASRFTFHASQSFWLILLIASAISAVLLFVIQRKDKFVSFIPVFLSICAPMIYQCPESGCGGTQG